jgi:hypothetical protein
MIHGMTDGRNIDDVVASNNLAFLNGLAKRGVMGSPAGCQHRIYLVDRSLPEPRHEASLESV